MNDRFEAMVRDYFARGLTPSEERAMREAMSRSAELRGVYDREAATSELLLRSGAGPGAARRRSRQRRQQRLLRDLADKGVELTDAQRRVAGLDESPLSGLIGRLRAGLGEILEDCASFSRSLGRVPPTIVHAASGVSGTKSSSVIEAIEVIVDLGAVPIGESLRITVTAPRAGLLCVLHADRTDVQLLYPTSTADHFVEADASIVVGGAVEGPAGEENQVLVVLFAQGSEVPLTAADAIRLVHSTEAVSSRLYTYTPQ